MVCKLMKKKKKTEIAKAVMLNRRLQNGHQQTKAITEGFLIFTS